MFALIADETWDNSGLEKFEVSIHWMDMCHTILKDVIGMVQVDQTDAATLASTPKDVPSFS